MIELNFYEKLIPLFEINPNTIIIIKDNIQILILYHIGI